MIASPETPKLTAPYLYGHHPSVLRSHRSRTARNSCPHLLPHLTSNPALRILDIGCGPGTISVDLATLVPRGHVVGLDYSDVVLASARAHADELGVTNVEFRRADAYALPFADGSFDVAHANQVLQHVTDPVAVLREMRRVVRPDGGIVALREGDAQVWHPEAADDDDDDGGEGAPGAVMKEWYAVWLRMAREHGVEPNTGRRLLSYALKAGFMREEVSAGLGNSCCGTEEELREWCDIRAERVVLSDFAGNALAGGYATKEDLERFSKAWREFPRQHGAWYGMLQGEAICKRSG